MGYRPSDFAAAKFYKLKDRGFVYSSTTVRFARENRLAIWDACALLQKETSGGHNVFGNDRVDNPVKRGKVTKARYKQYLGYRKAGLGNQGVGPGQLTWYGFQDECDKRGGCWKPRINMNYSFELFSQYQREKGTWEAAKRYNGKDSYANDFIKVRNYYKDVFVADKKKNPRGLKALRALLRLEGKKK